MSGRVREPRWYRLPDGRIGKVVHLPTMGEALEEFDRSRGRDRSEAYPERRVPAKFKHEK